MLRMIGLPELLVILLIVLLFFGAGRLRGVLRDLGKGVREFKDGLSGDEKSEEKKDSSSPDRK